MVLDDIDILKNDEENLYFRFDVLPRLPVIFVSL